MSTSQRAQAFVVGLDVAGTKTNAAVLEDAGTSLVDRMVETPSRVREGPAAAIEAVSRAMESALEIASASPRAVLAIGLATPGLASASGVISGKGAQLF